ncbi:hypothetical protein [uncultured Clostridium sp.]|uniref:hypothetical protein n=1 Tax=uncultured Clostridium sp. TaxID=59620 RepID=UPI0028F115C6|nr:hypothetical protein [uncultured Clostridium sp.]
MANKRLVKINDKVKFVNCKEANRYDNRTFTVKGRCVLNKKFLVTLNEVKGQFEGKHLEILS